MVYGAASMWGAAETATVFAGVENSLLHFVMSPGQKRYIHIPSTFDSTVPLAQVPLLFLAPFAPSLI
jgi:hypothetical protein